MRQTIAGRCEQAPVGPKAVPVSKEVSVLHGAVGQVLLGAYGYC